MRLGVDIVMHYAKVAAAAAVDRPPAGGTITVLGAAQILRFILALFLRFCRHVPESFPETWSCDALVDPFCRIRVAIPCPQGGLSYGKADQPVPYKPLTPLFV